MEDGRVNIEKNKSTVDYNVCRACLKSGDQLNDIYSSIESEITFAVIYTSCTSLNVSSDDNLPQKLCDKCRKILIEMHKFIEQCKESEQNFKEINKNDSHNCTNVKIEPDVCLQDLKDEENSVDLNVSEYDKVSDIKLEITKYNSESDDSTDLIPLSLHTRKRGLKSYKSMCHLCNKTFDRASRLGHHLKMHRKKNLKNNLLICKLCKKTFQKPSDLKRHIVVHDSTSKPFECTQCLQRFKRNDLLIKHTAIHTIDNDVQNFKNGTLSIVCEKCSLSFTSHTAYCSHIKSHENGRNKDGRFPCNICGKTFPVRTHMNRHMKLHTESKRFKCNLCEMSYSRVDQLIEHINKHKGVKPNVCSFCNKAFSQISKLNCHVKIHTGEKPYLCSYCGKGFIVNCNLRKHMLRHTDPKSFKCKLCLRIFVKKGQFTRHARSHAEDTPNLIKKT